MSVRQVRAMERDCTADPHRSGNDHQDLSLVDIPTDQRKEDSKECANHIRRYCVELNSDNAFRRILKHVSIYLLQ